MAFYRYPYEAITDTTDYLQITVKSHSGTPNSAATSSLVEDSVTFGTAGAAGSLSGNPAQVGVAAVGDIIILPMPSNISDSNSVGYGEDRLDILGAAAGGFAKDVMKAGAKVFGDNSAKTTVVQEIGNAFGRNLNTGGLTTAALDAFTRSLAASAAGIIGANVTAEQLLTRDTGQILNPNMELLFSGPTLRQFQFQFKFTPRDQNESYQVKSIIRSFKTNMAPSVEGAETSDGAGSNFAGQAFLKTPNIFELHYRKGNRDHPFLNRFKQCALTNMSVNYTGEGVYATYNDATPISMIMTLDFRELVPIYAHDYSEVTTATDLTYSATNNTTKGVGY